MVEWSPSQAMRSWRLLVLAWLSMALFHVTALRQAALVTGSTDGIGLTTAKNLAAQGYDVLIHGRDAKRVAQAQQAVQKFAADSHRQQVWALEPADLATVNGATLLARQVHHLCSTQGLQLEIVMNNAGVFSEDHVLTSDGLELTFAVNVVAPFVITSLLLPLLRNQPNKCRVVIASSISQSGSIRDWDDLAYQRRRYSEHAAYSESKLLDAMLTMEMAERWKKASLDRLTCNCLDPGTVNTKMLLAGWGPCGISVEDALDELWLCTSEGVDVLTGKYFVYRADRKASSSAYDKGQRNILWGILSELAPEAADMWNFDLQ